MTIFLEIDARKVGNLESGDTYFFHRTNMLLKHDKKKQLFRVFYILEKTQRLQIVVRTHFLNLLLIGDFWGILIIIDLGIVSPKTHGDIVDRCWMTFGIIQYDGPVLNHYPLVI